MLGISPTTISGPGTEPSGAFGVWPLRGRQDRRLGRAIDDRGDFDRIHAGSDRNLPDVHTNLRRPSQLVRKTFGNQKPSALHAEQMRSGIVFKEVSFNVEKDKARLPIANYQVKWLTRTDFFDDELLGGRI